MAYALQLFKPIRGKRTFEEISSEIKRLIFDGVLKPGDKLPSEIELAKMFAVGRQSVREALRLLERRTSISTGWLPDRPRTASFSWRWNPFWQCSPISQAG